MSTKNYENFKYVRDCDNDEWVFLDSDSNKEYLTSHNGCCCMADEDVLIYPYFSIKTTRIMEDDEVDYIRDATLKEVERMFAVARLNGYEFDEIARKFKKID